MLRNEDNFGRMIDGVDMLLAEMGLEAHDYEPYNSRVLKIEADPDTPGCVWVYIPETVFYGSKTNEKCAEWTSKEWAEFMAKLAKLFAVKGHASTRMMIPAPAKDSRIYANYFWARDESVREDMEKWNIVLEDSTTTENANVAEMVAAIETAKAEEVAAIETAKAEEEEDGEQQNANRTQRIKDIEEYQKKNFFMFM